MNPSIPPSPHLYRVGTEVVGGGGNAEWPVGHFCRKGSVIGSNLLFAYTHTHTHVRHERDSIKHEFDVYCLIGYDA